MARSIVVTEPIQLRSDFHAFTRPPTKHTDELLLLPTFHKQAQTTKFWVTGSAVQPSAGLPSSYSFHGEVCRSGRLLLSIPLVQLCAAHTPKSPRARFRAPPGSALLRRLTAPPCAHSLANYETNVFYCPEKAQFSHGRHIQNEFCFTIRLANNRRSRSLPEMQTSFASSLG